MQLFINNERVFYSFINYPAVKQVQGTFVIVPYFYEYNTRVFRSVTLHLFAHSTFIAIRLTGYKRWASWHTHTIGTFAFSSSSCEHNTTITLSVSGLKRFRANKALLRGFVQGVRMSTLNGGHFRIHQPWRCLPTNCPRWRQPVVTRHHEKPSNLACSYANSDNNNNNIPWV